jgi:hypothetical protein
MRGIHGFPLMAAAALSAHVSATPGSAGQASTDTFINAWVASVQAHQPGERDRALTTVAAWSPAEWDGVYPRVLTRLDTALGTDSLPTDVQGRTVFLKRAALLHTDIAMLEPTANEPTRVFDSPRVRNSLNVRVPDGRFDGLERGKGHWEVARTLLDRVTPAPQQDDDVRRWYRATAAAMSSWYGFSELILHLERSDRLFPTDPALQFNQGCLYEALASPRVQDVVAALILPKGLKVLVDSAPANLRRADERFSRVVSASPAWVEPRVRQARVWLLLGRQHEAAERLRALSSHSDDPIVQYFALMFLGQAEEALGRLDLTREAYDRAAVIYPGAQSARLALVNVERQQGRAWSLDALHGVLRLDDRSPNRDDPWWSYHRGDGRDAKTLLEDLQSRFRPPRS